MLKKNDDTESLDKKKNFIDKMSNDDAVSFLLQNHFDAAKIIKKYSFYLM